MQAARQIAAALFLLTLLSAVPAAPAGAAEPVSTEDARTAAHNAARGLDLQTEPPEKKYRPIKTENLPELPNIDIGAQVARYVLWGAAAVVLVIILMTLRDNLWSSSRRRRLRHEDAEELAPGASTARMDKAQGEADELARLGGFAEAMHLLLLQSVGELRLRLGISIAASLTSREILHRIGLAPEGRAAFADIIGRVEISYFGPHQPGKEEYLACRRNFETLTEALRRQGAA